VEKNIAGVQDVFEIIYSGKFKKDYRLMKKRGYDMKLLRDVVDLLRSGIPLDEKYKEHPLDGDYIHKFRRK
jgi:mRNA interferase YafQ